MSLGGAAGPALAADTLSIIVMELVDNARSSPEPWTRPQQSPLLGQLSPGSRIGVLAAFPVNRWRTPKAGPRGGPPTSLTQSGTRVDL
jgi:hypothetical protein